MSQGGGSSRKQVGTLFLDLKELQKNVDKANEQLKSLGTGVNLDMSDIVEKQVKQRLDALTKAAAKAASETKNQTKSLTQSLTDTGSSFARITKEIETRIAGESETIKKVVRGISTDGRELQKVFKNGSLVQETKTRQQPAVDYATIQKAKDAYEDFVNAQKQHLKLLKSGDFDKAKEYKQIWQEQQRIVDGLVDETKHLGNNLASRKKQLDLAHKMQRASVSNMEAERKIFDLSELSESDLKILKKAKNAYDEFVVAQKNFMTQTKSGNSEQAEGYRKVGIEQKKIIENLLEATANLDDECELRKRLIDLASKFNAKEMEGKKFEDDYHKSLNSSVDAAEKLYQKFTQIVSVMTILNGLKTLWMNAWEYSSSYYDSLNEIRIVTGLTEVEAEKLGEEYRKLAKEMSLSSTDIAGGAVEFWRQGLGEEDVNSRLVETSKYAKISGQEFNEAAELITAATNSMELDAERVVDVFAYLGDASASGADEIGTAMQKATAAAQEFGLSFEWLGAYIATISEKTRLAPEVIGTSMNSIMARLHSIKQIGYNSEDQTKINDISKALNEVGISLMDNQNQWRDLSDIFNDVAAVWDTLDSKTKSYIATTMAGTRQQNFFLTLMNDLAKGVNGGSRAWELYTGALTSAGAATEKYAIWEESVTAAQNRLKVATEEFYSLMDAGWMKGWYDFAANIISLFKQGTDFAGGLNILLPIIAVGFVGVHVAIKSVRKEMQGAVTASALLKAMWVKHPMVLAAGAIALVAGGLTLAFGAFETSSEKFESATENLEDATAQIEKLKTEQQELVSSFTELSQKTYRTASEEKEFEAVLQKIAGTSNEAAAAVDAYSNDMAKHGAVIDAVNQKYGDLIANEKERARLAAVEALSNYQISDESKNAKWKESHTNYNYVNQMRHKLINQGFSGEALEDQLRYLEQKNHDAFSKDIDNIINLTLQGLDGQINSLEEGFLRKELLNRAIGPDGIADYVDINSAKKIGANLISTFSSGENLFEDNQYRSGFLEYVAEMFFGEEASSVFANEIKRVTSSSDIPDKLSSTYEELIKLGLSEVDFQSMVSEGMSLEDLANAPIDLLLNNALQGKISTDILSQTDAETKALIMSLLNAGTSVEEIDEMFGESKNAVDFKNRLAGLNQELTTLSEEADSKSLNDLIKESQSLIETFNGVREAISQGQKPSQNDISVQIEKYPHLLTLMGNRIAFEKELLRLQTEEQESLDSYWRSWAGSNTELAKSSEWSDQLSDTIVSLDMIQAMLYSSGNVEEADRIEAYLLGIANAAQQATTNVEAYGEAKNSILRADSLMNAAMGIRPESGITDQVQLLEYYDVLENAFGDQLIGLERGSMAYLEKALNLAKQVRAEADAMAAGFGVSNTIKLKTSIAASKRTNDKWVSDAEKDGYRGGMQFLRDSVLLADKAGEDIVVAYESALGKLDSVGLLEPMAEMFGDIGIIAEGCENDISSIIQRLYELEEAAIEMDFSDRVQEIRDERAGNYAESSGYKSGLGDLSSAFENGGVSEMMEAYYDLDSTVRDGLVDSYHSLAIAMDDANKAIEEYGEGSEEAIKATEILGREFKKAQKSVSTKNFKNTAKAIADLEDGTINAYEAMEIYSKDMETAAKANDEYNAACQSMANGTEVAAEDIETLADYLGVIDPSWLLSNWDKVGPMLSSALAEGEDAFRRLQEAAFINITGSSSVDFSDLENGLITTEGMAEDTLKALLDLGMFTVENKELNTEAWVWQGTRLVKKSLSGFQQVLKPTGSNPFKGRGISSSSGKKSSGGGSSGGGSGSKNSSTNEMSEIEKMLDRMKQIDDIQKHSRSLYSSASSMYEGRGELLNAIKFYEKEIEAIEEHNETLEGNLALVEQHMKQKQAEVAAMSTSDEAYEQAAKDLKDLQETHQSYTLELMSNQSAVDDLTEKIKDQRDAIRDMEIGLRETILKAIEDRIELQERMLQGTIDTENEILDLLTKRYEKERDQLLEVAELKREALQEEINLLDEQLQKRKEMAEEEDKLAKLRQLETNLARISADPTRRKEQLELQKEITELREEIAWDLAEKETEAQKEGLEDQLMNVEDYMEYVESYYEDLFEHPRRLVEEMTALMQRTDEEILDWLKQNSEEFQESTTATQTDMVNNWQSMLDDMRGSITTYWDEVEYIIQQGDEYILQFLMENSAEYREAGRLQAEAYVDQWIEQLDDLRNAYKQTAEDIAIMNYNIIRPSLSVDSGSGGSGSGGSSKPSSMPSQTVQQAALAGVLGAVAGMAGGIAGSSVANSIINGASSVKKYASGGLVDYTGLAWVDGSLSKPEGFLNPPQTEMIGQLAKTLEMMRINVPTLTSGTVKLTDKEKTDGIQVSGDIVIQVEKLETEEDIEKMTRLIEETMYAKLSRGSAIGGIRLR